MPFETHHNDNMSIKYSQYFGSLHIYCNCHGIILDVCFLSAETYELQVPEDHKLNEKIGTLELEDRDQMQNKEPIFTIPIDNGKVFNIELSPNKDGNLMLKQV